METDLSKPWFGVWNVTRTDRVVTNEAGSTIAMVPVLFSEDDALHTEKIIIATINRQNDLVDSMHRQALRNEELTATLNQCVEALDQFVRYASSGHHAAWGKYLGTHAGSKMLAALVAAKKAKRGE